METLFVDMDGTLARFYEAGNAVREYRTRPDFFLELRPYAGLVEAIRELRQEGKGILILSAVDEDIRERSVRQKEQWLRQVFGEDIPYALYPRTGSSKAEYIRSVFGTLDREMWLLDDYTRNLAEWTCCGGSAIKAKNEINSLGGKWKGPRLDICGDREEILQEMRRIMALPEIPARPSGGKAQ